MKNDGEISELAKAVKGLFEDRYGEFTAEDFMAAAEALGFNVYKRAVPEEGLKPVAENYFPDIIGTNLQYAVEAYVWETHVPMTEDDKIVSGFWDRRKEDELPEGYNLAAGGRMLKRC